MFVGMCFGLIMHWAALYFHLPFPGYYWPEDGDNNDSDDKDLEKNSKNGVAGSETQPLVVRKQTSTVSSSADVTIPTWMYFFLAIPSLFDTLATFLCMTGLRYIDVSIYQMLRGSGIIFVALMKQHGQSVECCCLLFQRLIRRPFISLHFLSNVSLENLF